MPSLLASGLAGLLGTALGLDWTGLARLLDTAMGLGKTDWAGLLLAAPGLDRIALESLAAVVTELS